jgi:hypothetical protein
MNFFTRALLAGLVLCPIGMAAAQTQPGKRYAQVAARYDRAAAQDADLVALVTALRAAAQAQDKAPFEAAMSPKFVALDCTANPLEACGPGKGKGKAIGGKTGKPLDRMRLAFCCEGKPSADPPLAAQDETMFAILTATLGATTLGANPDAKGEVCAPALPAFDRAKAAKAARAAGVEPENLRVSATDTSLRPRPSRTAEPVATLGAGDLAPVVTDLTSDTPAGWTAIGLPDGSIGYTDALGLEELTPAAICFAREKGGWRIVGTIQRGA